MRPIHDLIVELADQAPRLMETSQSRLFLLSQLGGMFQDPVTLRDSLTGPDETDAICELAAIALQAAELEGVVALQRRFRKAIETLAPLGSPQWEWAKSRSV